MLSSDIIYDQHLSFKVNANVPGLVLPPKIFLPKRKVIIKANIFPKNENETSSRAPVIEKKRSMNAGLPLFHWLAAFLVDISLMIKGVPCLQIFAGRKLAFVF